VNSRKGDHVYNFHYHPQDWSRFRQELPRIVKRLEERGHSPQVSSFADICLGILQESSMFAAMQGVEAMGSFPHSQRNDDLYGILAGAQYGSPLPLDGPIVSAILNAIDTANSQPNGILILVDAEAIHPLFRVSAFEQILQGKFLVPTVICYPGERGDIGDNPSFLGIYKADGNYRSTHIY